MYVFYQLMFGFPPSHKSMLHLIILKWAKEFISYVVIWHFFRAVKGCQVQHNPRSRDPRAPLHNLGSVFCLQKDPNLQPTTIQDKSWLLSPGRAAPNTPGQGARWTNHRILPKDAAWWKQALAQARWRHLFGMFMRVPAQGDTKDHPRMQPLLPRELHRWVAQIECELPLVQEFTGALFSSYIFNFIVLIHLISLRSVFSLL